MEVKVHIPNIETLKTTTGVKVETDKDGKEVSRRLITKVSFEAEITPAALSNVHHLLAVGAPVHALIGSEQAIMEVAEGKEPAFAGT